MLKSSGDILSLYLWTSVDRNIEKMLGEVTDVVEWSKVNFFGMLNDGLQ